MQTGKSLSLLEKLFPPSPYHKENLPAACQSFAESDAYNFVLWASTSDLKTNQFKNNFLSVIVPRLEQERSDTISFWLRDDTIKSITLRDRPISKSNVSETGSEKIAALIRICQQSEADAKQLIADLQSKGFRVAAYHVKNSVPLNCAKSDQKTWKNGQQSPGLVSISFFKKNKGISRDFFQQYWFYSHTPFALDIHPLWKYERNVVLKALTPEAPDYQGIVPLHVKHDADLSFARFFSHDGKSALGNALRIQADVKRFIDLSAIETVAMREYVVR